MANPFRQDYKVRRKKRTALFQIVYTDGRYLRVYPETLGPSPRHIE
jgi:hypothetical protein